MAEHPNPNPNPTPTPDGPDTGHDYDGIRELDNHLPNWWLLTLFLTVVFGYGYWLYYHVYAGPGTKEEYLAELAEADRAAAEAARLRGAPTDAGLRALATNAHAVETGQQLFGQYCVACHGVQGQGQIGPNLTDRFWLHGRGKPTAVYQVISAGVAAKGMPGWEAQLGPDKVEKLTGFVLTLSGRQVPGKEPQGEPADGSQAATASSTPGRG